MITIQQVCEYNKKHVNWVKFFSVVDTLGKTMNGQKDRFDKSDIIEMALASFSNDKIEYVNDDGVDHRLTDLMYKNKPVEQEMKFFSEVFYGMRVTQRKTKNQKKIETISKLTKPVSLKLVNSHGTNGHAELPKTYAQFVIVVDNNSAFVIATETLKPYLKCGGDGIEAKSVPSELFMEIIGPDKLSERKRLESYDYKKAKIKFQQDFLAQFA